MTAKIPCTRFVYARVYFLKISDYNFQLLLLVTAKIFRVVLGCFTLVVRITQLHKSWTEVFYLVPLVLSLIVDFTLTFAPGLDYEPQTPEDTPRRRGREVTEFALHFF